MSTKSLMYCKKCHYPLVQLCTPMCPEWGQNFDPANHRTFSRTGSKARLGFKAWLVLLLALYIGGYGAARWRKLLVRHEFTMVFKVGNYVYSVKAGVDQRDHGIGAVKNAIAAPVAWIYSPLRSAEAGFWNWHEDRGDE